MTAVDRPHAVLICYACEPGAGSEEGVGWTWAVAAAEVAEVTLFTHPLAVDLIESTVAELDLSIRVIGIEPPKSLRVISQRRRGGFVYYLLWQIAVAKALREMERTERVDVVHHVTWASDSLPSALLVSRAPVRVWGPIGGVTRLPWNLYRYLSPRARFDEVVRDFFNGGFRFLAGSRVARHATLILAMNPDVEVHFARGSTPVVLEPNCVIDAEDLLARSESFESPPTEREGARHLRTALFVGRLLGWKGPLLAVESLAHAPDWRLVVFGDGEERERALALARDLGVDDRLEFRGLVPRAEVLAAFRSADALLFPSFHDSASWAVGEAASLGCPVVCLDAGGPPLVAGRHAHVVERQPARTLALRMGGALQLLGQRGEPEDRWQAARLPGLMRNWYAPTLERHRTQMETTP